MSEQKILQLFNTNTYVEYKDFLESGIYQLESTSYFDIFQIYTCLNLFKTYESESNENGYQKLLEIMAMAEFLNIEQHIPSIQNKLLLAKIYYFKSFFVLCNIDKARKSIEEFKTSANYFVGFILENEIHEHSCYDLITGVINLFKHKYFNQLEEPILSKLDDCISKLYTANKICYLDCCQAASLTDRQYKDKINQLLHPLISDFDNEILALDKFFLSTLIKTYPNLFNITLDHLRLIKTDLVDNNPDAYQIIKTIASKLPNTTTGLIEFKAEVENDIAECQKYLFNHISKTSIDFGDITKESDCEMTKILEEYQENINTELTEKKSPIEKICYLLSEFNNTTRSNYDFYFDSTTQDFKPEILPDRGVIDLLGFGDTYFKLNMIDKQLTGVEAQKQQLIFCYLDALLNISNVLFNALVNEIKNDQHLQECVCGLINQNSFFEHRKEETLIVTKMFTSNEQDLIYAAMFLLVPNLEFCFQQNINNAGLIASTTKRNGEFSRHSRYMTDIVNNWDEMSQLGFENYEICLLKTLFSEPSEIKAGFNLRNDLMHGAIPLSGISLSFSKLLFFISLDISRKFLLNME